MRCCTSRRPGTAFWSGCGRRPQAEAAGRLPAAQGRLRRCAQLGCAGGHHDALTKYALGLRLTGIALCAVRSINALDCACLHDLFLSQSKELTKDRLVVAAHDWVATVADGRMADEPFLRRGLFSRLTESARRTARHRSVGGPGERSSLASLVVRGTSGRGRCARGTGG